MSTHSGRADRTRAEPAAKAVSARGIPLGRPPGRSGATSSASSATSANGGGSLLGVLSAREERAYRNELGNMTFAQATRRQAVEEDNLRAARADAADARARGQEQMARSYERQARIAEAHLRLIAQDMRTRRA